MTDDPRAKTCSNEDAIAHCVSKVCEISRLEEPGPRQVLQLGYNLGRLSELTGLGRETFWDRWKDPVDAWDRERLDTIATDLARWSAETRAK